VGPRAWQGGPLGPTGACGSIGQDHDGRTTIMVVEDRDPMRQSSVEEPVIAAAIVVTGGWVLMIRRSVAERELLWQFPAGKIEPGESAEEAAVREAFEGTGVVVARATRSLGQRLHRMTARTARTVVYVWRASWWPDLGGESGHDCERSGRLRDRCARELAIWTTMGPRNDDDERARTPRRAMPALAPPAGRERRMWKGS